MKRRGNGEGTIYQRGDGRWEGRLVLADGHRRSVYGETQREIADKILAARAAAGNGIPVPVASERQTFGEYLASWLEAVKPPASPLRPKTWHRYEQLLRIHVHPGLGHVRLAQLAPQHLQALYAARLGAGAAASTIRHVHALLHRALQQAVRWNVLHRNVVELVDPPKAARHDIVTLTEEQARAFLEGSAGDRHRNLYALALGTGMRQGELFGLRWRDVDLDRRMLQIRQTISRVRGDDWTFGEPKTKHSRRRIELSQSVIAALRRQRKLQLEERLAAGPAWEDLDLVFPNEVGRPLHPANLTMRSFRPVLARAGCPRIRFHDLRHTCATLLLGRGVHAKIVSEMLGHASIAITLDLYSHVIPTMQREAVEVLDAVLGSTR